MMRHPDHARTIFDEIGKLFPEAKCELSYTSNLDLLVAIILSAQTTDEAVNQVTQELFNRYRTLQDYATASLSDLEAMIRSIGLYRSKARNIQSMAQKVLDDFSGEIPSVQMDLESLPGVGRKTANVYLAEWHHVPRIAVDTHVKRVSIRLGLAYAEDSVAMIEERLMIQYPEADWILLHHRLIFFGRYFCKAKKPECLNCPLYNVCRNPVFMR